MRYLESEVIECYKKAGRLAREALERGKKMCKVGLPYFDIVKEVESVIREGGGFPAFPVNVSVNDVGAHYTPYPGDGKRFRPGDIVKIDVGCHVDGYIADNATTVEIGSNIYGKMIETTEMALDAAIETVRPGIQVKEIGAAIEDIIKSAGYQPIRNLTGHRMERYVLHSGLSIPNIKRGRDRIEEDMVLAIEPFATDGIGRVDNGVKGEIYILRKQRRLNEEDKDFYLWLKDRFNTLPFASYWCSPYSKAYLGKLSKLERRGVVMSYPLLMEEGQGKVSQREHTVLVTKDGAEVLTRI